MKHGPSHALTVLLERILQGRDRQNARASSVGFHFWSRRAGGLSGAHATAVFG